jgi:MFS superfamily sulfate permease-like transporter
MQYIPEATLGAIVTYAVVFLIDIPAAISIARHKRKTFLYLSIFIIYDHALFVVI